MKYDKLVRDKIPDIIKSKGGKVSFHTATEDEYWRKLKEKLEEEVAEFKKDESAEEIADIFEVLHAIIEYKGFREDVIEETKREKKEKKGGFEKRFILEES
jgi:predicted house-cleaning noncanonical NTP pyrophosphatase (MazG superfamily)